MVFLFWNLNRRNIPALVSELAYRHAVDVILLAESTLAWKDLAPHLNAHGSSSNYRPPTILGERGNRLTFITRLPEHSISPVADFVGVSLRTIEPPLGPEVLLAA